MLYGLDLFSGIGGITEALSEWVRPVAYCESNRYAQGVLVSRMVKGQLPRAPIWDDVTTLRGSNLPRGIDIIYGGFPCQDVSFAGRRVGLDGERSGLVSEVWRLADEIRPKFIFLENVPAILNSGLDRILAELAERRFDARWICLSASDVGACHVRNRWWLLAYSDSRSALQLFSYPAMRAGVLAKPSDNGREGDVANTHGASEGRHAGRNGVSTEPSNIQCRDGEAGLQHVIEGGTGDATDTHGSGLEGWHSGVLRERPDKRTSRSSGASLTDTNRAWELQQGGLICEVGEWSGNDLQDTDTSGEGLSNGAAVAVRGERAKEPERLLRWPTVAPLCGTNDGIPRRSDRIAALGNSVVPQCAREAFKILMQI